jgi:hypothetical protein
VPVLVLEIEEAQNWAIITFIGEQIIWTTIFKESP